MKTVPLGDLCHIRIGRTPSRANPDYWGGPHQWAAISDLNDASLTSTREGVTDLAVQEARLQPVAPGTLLYSFKLTIGKMAVAATTLYTNEAIAALVPRDGSGLDSDYLRYALATIDGGAGASTAVKGRTLNSETLARLPVPVVPIHEQRKIVAQLTAHLAAAEQAKQMARQRTAACDALVAQVLRTAVSRAGRMPSARLSNVVELQRSPSVTSDGDVVVRTVTSGCLTPAGFTTEGLSTSRMTADAAVLGVISAGEVLVARSNTEELVGRAALYPGGPEVLVASDLIFRLAPDPTRLMPEFLAMHLAGLQLAGYWRNRSSGASSTMKKITKALLLDLQIPVPPLDEQRRITEELRERLDAIDVVGMAARAQRDAIEALPAALLRRAFENSAT